MTFQIIACNSINQLYHLLHFNPSACVMNQKKIRKWVQLIDLLVTSFTSIELKFRPVQKYCTCYWSGSEAEKFHLCKSYFLNESHGTTWQVKYIYLLSLSCHNIKESLKQVGRVYQQNLLEQHIVINLNRTGNLAIIFSVRCSEMELWITIKFKY